MEAAAAAEPKRTLVQDLRALLECPRELWLVFVATTLEYVSVYSFLVTLALWLTSDYGLGDESAGWWAATFSTLMTLFMLMIGAVADAIGIRRTLVISFGLSTVLRTVMALAPGATIALTALIAYALAFASGSPVLQVSVHRYASKPTRAIAFSLWYVAINIGGAISGYMVDFVRGPFLDPSTHKLVTRTLALPLLGATTMSAYRAVMGAGAITAALAFLVTLMLRTRVEHEQAAAEGARPEAEKKNPFALLFEVARGKPFWRFMLLLGLLSLVKMMFQHMHFTWPKYVTRELGDEFPWGQIWALNSLLILFLAPLTTALTRHMPVLNVLMVGAFVSAASPFVLCFGSSYAYQVAMVLVLTLGEALWSPRSYEYTVAIAPEGRESTYASLAQFPYFFAKFLVGPTSGYLLATYCPEVGPRHPVMLWALVGISTMLGPVGILALRKTIVGKPAAA